MFATNAPRGHQIQGVQAEGIDHRTRDHPAGVQELRFL